MNRNRFGTSVTVVFGFVFMCAASALDRTPAASTNAIQTPNSARHAAQPNGDPLPADDFSGLSYTADQKAEIDRIHRETESHKAVIAKDEKLTADQKNAMLLGYTRMEYGSIYKVLSPEQQKQVRQRIHARRSANHAEQK